MRIPGVGAHVFLPQVMLNAIYDASTFFATYKGKFKADVKNLSVIMEVHISRNETEKINIIEVNVIHENGDKYYWNKNVIFSSASFFNCLNVAYP